MKAIIKLISILLIFTALIFANSNKKIVVNLSTQEAFAYEDNKLVMKGFISSGQAKYKTPTGRYKVLAKEKFHISNEWPKPDGGAEMPYMLRLTWSGIALHLGYVPNYPASHGCIRLTDGFAQELFKWADIGTRVIIKGKTPRRVSRRHRSRFYLTRYFYKKYKTSYKKEQKYLAKLKKELRRLSRAHKLAMLKKKRKRVYIAKQQKIVMHYAKYSYKKLNRILKYNYRKKSQILASKKLSKKEKQKALRKISWVVKIIKKAKYIKRHHRYIG